METDEPSVRHLITSFRPDPEVERRRKENSNVNFLVNAYFCGKWIPDDMRTEWDYYHDYYFMGRLTRDIQLSYLSARKRAIDVVRWYKENEPDFRLSDYANGHFNFVSHMRSVVHDREVRAARERELAERRRQMIAELPGKVGGCILSAIRFVRGQLSRLEKATRPTHDPS